MPYYGEKINPLLVQDQNKTKTAWVDNLNSEATGGLWFCFLFLLLFRPSLKSTACECNPTEGNRPSKYQVKQFLQLPENVVFQPTCLLLKKTYSERGKEER